MAYVTRLVQILFALGGYLGWMVLVHLRLLRPPMTPAQRLSHTLERLGTTFVKLGQMLSLRRDLLPDAYIEALQQLQDRVAPFPAAEARRQVEQGLGYPVTTLFAEFDGEPLGSASIAQVHRARLRDGRPVVVKIRRPDIRVQVMRDMRLLRLALRLLAPLAPPLRRLRPLALIRELEDNLAREMDFRLEARSIRRFAEAFRDWETIYVPVPIDNLYGESVLVQAMSGGRRVDDPTLWDDGPRLAEAFVDAYLHQFFVLGLFHGDPHPGNLFITDEGRICFHDFGIVGFLDGAARRNLAGFTQAFVHQDGDWLLDAYLDLGVLGGELDRTEFRHGLESLLDDYAGRPLKDWAFAEAFMRIARLGQGQNIRLPHTLLVLMRALFLMETTVRSLDPGFNLVDGLKGRAEQVLKKTVWRRTGDAASARLRYEVALLAQDLPPALGRWLHGARTHGLEMPLRHRGLEQLAEHIDRSSNRMALAMVTLGLYIAASLLMQHSLGPRLGGIPLLAGLGYGLALWFTWRLARGISRSGRL